MIVHKVQQGTEEWLKLRCGIPTASCFSQILTPGGKPSESARVYLHKLLAERMTGKPLAEHVSTWMDRGLQMEEEAVSYYELQRGCDTEKVGLITNDAGTIGASPDRLVGEDGLLEIKVPSPQVHIGYLIGAKGVDKAYVSQTQGQLWISERAWLDIESYSPDGMPSAIISVPRDEEYIGKLAAAVSEFSRVLEENAAEFVARGLMKKEVACQ